MRWFEGNVADAVALSKSRKAVFVVFVEGADNASQTLLSVIDSVEVTSRLESSCFVAIKLDIGTESYHQFAQIYQVVPVPSLFFIGRDGRPLEIVAGASSSTEILKRIDTVLAKTAEPASDVSASVRESVPSTSETARTPSAKTPQGTSTAPSTSAVAEGTDAAKTTADDQDAAAKNKEKVEALRVQLEKNRLKKLEEEKAKELEKEMERRKVGQDMQNLRRWQQDQEYKQLKEDREREKREEAAARERVRNQIAQDKAERAKRNSQVQEKKEPEAEAENVPRPVSRSDTARLQLRFPDGNIVTHQLSASASLRELRAFVSERLNQAPASFIMSTTFPRRVLSCEEDSQTMNELELVPTAVLLILPGSSAGVVRSSGGTSALTQLFWKLLMPVLSVYTYVRNYLFGGSGGGGGGGSSSGTANSRRRPPSEPSSQGPARRATPTSTVRRQGNSNVHRLAQSQDSSDEDNNTWNGNSTQQK